MIPATINLFLKRGISFNLSIVLLQGDPIRVAEEYPPNSSTILIEQLRSPLPSGSRLLFGSDIQVTLSSDAALGVEAIACTPQPLRIPKGMRGRQLLNLTGCTARAQIRRKAGEQPLASMDCVIDADPLSGLIEVSLSSSQTAVIPSNVSLQFVITDEELAARKPQPSDFLWDLEILYPDGRVENPVGGCVIIAPEVTAP